MPGIVFDWIAVAGSAEADLPKSEPRLLDSETARNKSGDRHLKLLCSNRFSFAVHTRGAPLQVDVSLDGAGLKLEDRCGRWRTSPQCQQSEV
jgi:hypothetical protein